MVALFVMKDAGVADEVSDMVRSSAPESARLIVNDKIMVVYAAAGSDHATAVAARHRGAVAASRAPPPGRLPPRPQALAARAEADFRSPPHLPSPIGWWRRGAQAAPEQAANPTTTEGPQVKRRLIRFPVLATEGLAMLSKLRPPSDLRQRHLDAVSLHRARRKLIRRDPAVEGEREDEAHRHERGHDQESQGRLAARARLRAEPAAAGGGRGRGRRAARATRATPGRRAPLGRSILPRFRPRSRSPATR